MIDPNAVETVLETFVPLIQSHRARTSKPFVLGVSGLQGSGKSTWAAALCEGLVFHNLKSRTLSLDDLYLDHTELFAIREANTSNLLLRNRGQPGTHDEALAQSFFDQVLRTNNTSNDEDIFVKWPAYDKSLHNGQGGRVPMQDWELVNLNLGLDVVVFEGWCLGFQPLDKPLVALKWEESKASTVSATQTSDNAFSLDTLACHSLRHLQLINENLRRYCETFTGPKHFDGFLHLSTEDLTNVYGWRLDQEKALRNHKSAMSDEQVLRFVRSYMPAYELFLDRLQRENLFGGDGHNSSSKQHLQVVLNETREVVQVKRM